MGETKATAHVKAPSIPLNDQKPFLVFSSSSILPRGHHESGNRQCNDQILRVKFVMAPLNIKPGIGLPLNTGQKRLKGKNGGEPGVCQLG